MIGYLYVHVWYGGRASNVVTYIAILTRAAMSTHLSLK